MSKTLGIVGIALLVSLSSTSADARRFDHSYRDYWGSSHHRFWQEPVYRQKRVKKKTRHHRKHVVARPKRIVAEPMSIIPLPRSRPTHDMEWLDPDRNPIFAVVTNPLKPAINLIEGFRREVEAAMESTPVGHGMVALRTRNGHRYVVARKYATRFAGFVSNLEATGYRIRFVGGYAYRRIDPRYTGGRSILSKHAMGAAIDVNQIARNRVVVDMDRGLVARIAARWGLKSGGGWRSPDLGHFEVAGTRAVAAKRRHHRYAAR